MRSEIVRQYQKRLNALGFKAGPEDGIKGPKTLRAVKAFQKSKGLVVDGIVGPNTKRALYPKTAASKKGAVSHKGTPWMTEALKIKGWHEVRNRKALYKWLRSDGTSVGDPSKIPWCGDFTETAIKRSLPNEPFPGPVGQNPYWARNWVHFGVKSKPRYGAVLVFVRNGGGHVGFYVGEDKTHYHVLGGNQSNAVTVSRIAKSRCIGVRFPKTSKAKTSAKSASSKGVKVSTNEA